MTCRDLAGFLAGYIDDTLPAPVRRQFEQHLEECPDCVNYLQQYRDTIRLTARAGDDELMLAMPEDLVRAIVLSARSERSE